MNTDRRQTVEERLVNDKASVTNSELNAAIGEALRLRKNAEALAQRLDTTLQILLAEAEGRDFSHIAQAGYGCYRDGDAFPVQIG